jgi:GNAT superfamily N-acetyltransferase
MKDYPELKGYTDTFFEIIQFLRKQNEKGRFLSFHWSRFEWMFARDGFDANDLPFTKLIYQNDSLVGAFIFEDKPDHYFLVYEDDLDLKRYMVNYLRQTNFLMDLMVPQDDEMTYLLKIAGFESTSDIDQLSRFTLSDFELPKPEGYSIQNLASNPDMKEVQYALWRGFNHGDDVPYDHDSIQGRDHMFSSPHFKREYAYVAATQEHFVCFVGIWYMKGDKTAAIEPVATVPDHRQKGLAKACIYHAIQKVKDAGAKEIYVGSDQISYLKIGFVPYDHLTRFTKKTSDKTL